MEPTIENVAEIAKARAPRRGLEPEAVIQRAMQYVESGKVRTAPQAVEWAFHDLIVPSRGGQP
jgi:Tfp pilus assembly protein PilF